MRNPYANRKRKPCGCNRRPRGSAGIQVQGAPDALFNSAFNETRGMPDFELPAYQDPQQGNYETRGPIQTLGGTTEADYYFENGRWWPRTYAAAMDLLAQTLANVGGRADLCQYVAEADGSRGRPLADLAALPSNFEALFVEIDVAYSLAVYAGEAASDKTEALQPLLELWPGVQDQLDRIPNIIKRANARAQAEGYDRGYFDGWNAAMKERRRNYDRFFDSVDHAVEAAEEVAKRGLDTLDNAVDEAGKQAPWLAVAAAAAAVIVVATVGRK